MPPTHDKPAIVRVLLVIRHPEREAIAAASAVPVANG